MSLKSLLLCVSLIVSCFFCANAQITTSTLSGKVNDEALKSLPGAIIKATHTPTGSNYGAITEIDGNYNIQNMKPGGPYTVHIIFGGTEIGTFENIFLSLGENFRLDYNQKVMSKELSGITISSTRDNLFNNQRTGAESIITADQMKLLPSVSRSISDFTRLTPQSTGSSFAGRNSLYNNIRLNGANFNNSFGLSSGLPGGGQPFSMDAVQQIQVAISPYDVRQSDFTGANISLISRNGTNDLTGSAYTYYRDETFNGRHVGDVDLPAAIKSVNHIYGLSIGGPIIKNKLFFFVNGEFENNVHPGLSPAWIANANGTTGPNISRVIPDSLQKVSDYVKTKYGYNTGAYQGYANNFADVFGRFLARLDYNLNEKNKINVTFTQYNSTVKSTVNSTSAANGSLSTARNGANSLAFANTAYDTKHIVSAVSAELLSSISNSVSNQLLVSYTRVQDTRSSPSSKFPFVDIESGATTSDNYTSLGYELFSYKNDVKYNTLAFYDNATITKGKHLITGGVSFQYLTFANSFLPYGTSYYRFNSINDFVTNQAPIGFGYTYPYEGQDGYAKMKYGLPGVYGQDRFTILPNLTVTAGLRIDMPMYLTTIKKNAYVDTLNLYDPSGNITHYDISKLPESKPLFSPRLAFNWSPLKDRSLQVRGGSGIFVGQIPFVWLTNAPANSGTVSNNVQINSSSVLKYLTFQPTPEQALAQLPEVMRNQYFPKQGSNSVPGQIAAVAPNFKMPEVWRSTLAADYRIPTLNLVATVELLYTKDIQSVYQFNANQPLATGKLADSNDTRALYPSGRKYSFISGAYILENSNKGEAYSATFGLTYPSKKGFTGSIFYTASYASEVSQNPGSQASSAWFFVEHINSPNDLKLSPSSFFTPHRVVASLSYKHNYLKHLASSLSIYFNAETGGRFSYLSYADINNDGVYNDLIYIPKNVNEMNWADIKDRNTGKILFTAAQQAEAFNAYINQDKYLKSHRGQYAERNGAHLPFYSRVDLKFVQEVFTDIGKHHNSLEFSVDVLNAANMLNSKWGVQKRLAVSSGQIINGSTDPSTGITFYKMQTIVDAKGNTVLPTSTFIDNVSIGSTWGMQLGLKYNF